MGFLLRICNWLANRAASKKRKLNLLIGELLLQAIDEKYFDQSQTLNLKHTNQKQQNFVNGIRHYISAIQVYEISNASSSILDHSFHTAILLNDRVLTASMRTSFDLIKSLIV
jgi:hypothetical protein